jgi:hypothetical protein
LGVVREENREMSHDPSEINDVFRDLPPDGGVPDLISETIREAQRDGRDPRELVTEAKELAKMMEDENAPDAARWFRRVAQDLARELGL